MSIKFDKECYILIDNEITVSRVTLTTATATYLFIFYNIKHYIKKKSDMTIDFKLIKTRTTHLLIIILY